MPCRSSTETYLCMEQKPETEEIAELLKEMPEEVKWAMLNQMIGVKIAVKILNRGGDKHPA